MSWKNTEPLPLASSTPPSSPSMRPLSTSTQPVSRPRVRPPAKATNATCMLLVKIWAAKPVLASAPKCLSGSGELCPAACANCGITRTA